MPKERVNLVNVRGGSVIATVEIVTSREYELNPEDAVGVGLVVLGLARDRVAER